MTVRQASALVLCLLPISLCGCEMWHNLQPHRMRRLNRVSPPHLDPEFTRREPAFGEPAIVRAQNGPGVADAGL